MVIVSPGWLFSKDETDWLITVLAGLGPVVTSHMVRLVPPAFAVEDAALPPPAAEPHAASATAIVAVAAIVSHLRPLVRSPDLPMAFPPHRKGHFDTFRKVSIEVIVDIPIS